MNIFGFILVRFPKPFLFGRGVGDVSGVEGGGCASVNSFFKYVRCARSCRWCVVYVTHLLPCFYSRLVGARFFVFPLPDGVREEMLYEYVLLFISVYTNAENMNI